MILFIVLLSVILLLFRITFLNTDSFLTNGMLGVERFPISFKSVFNGNVHRHVVLGIYYSGRWGTIGMSRREELMYKPLIFKVQSYNFMI